MDPFQTKFHICWPNNLRSRKIYFFLKCKSPHLAILVNIWHIWEDRSRKVNNDEPDLRFFHGNFWPVIDQAVRKPCPRGVYRFHPFPEKWLASGFLDSRWVPGFTIGSWIHDGSSILRKAEDLMPRDIMSSEPRHWMVFGQLVMPVQCCAEARRRRRASAQHCTGMTNWPNTIQCLG